LSGALGESSADTKSALGAAIPALMGQVANKAQSEDGANQLMDMIGDNDGSQDFSSMLSNKDALLKNGSGMLSGLMGNQSSGFSGMLSKFTGMGGSKMTSLLGMVAPLIMGTLGKAKSTMGLNASGLSSLLSEQSESFQSAMPSGLADKMGSFGLGSLAGGVKGAAGSIGGAVSGAAGGVKNVGGKIVDGAGDLGSKAVGGVKAGAGAVGNAAGDLGRGAANVAGDVGRGTANVAGDVADAGGGLMRKLGPLLGLLLLGLIALWGWRSCGSDAGNIADKAVNTTKNVTSKAAEATKSVAGKAADATKNAAGAVADGAGKAVDATKDVAGKAVDATKDVAGKAADATKDAAGAVGSAVKKGADALGFTANSAEATLANSLSSGKAKLGDAIALRGVNFATGSANLENSSFKQLDNIQSIMKSYPNLKVKLEGHTDNVGNADKNKTLSNARATAVMNYLVSKGVNKARLSAEGFGDSKPIADNKNPDGRKQNRRVAASIAGL